MSKMSSVEKKIKSPVYDKENEKTRIQSLIEKELDLEESILNEELSDIALNQAITGEQSKKVEDVTEKNLEDILLNDMSDKPSEIGDSDNQDDDLKLRWEDDLEEEAALLEDPIEKSGIESCKIDLTFQEDVIQTIEDEEQFLDALDEVNEVKDSVPSSVVDTPFVPKTAHGLNKPDMMLEIPTQELIECSDDEGDLMNNLEMSPDEVLEVNNDNSKDIDEDILLGSEEEKSNENLRDSKSHEINNDDDEVDDNDDMTTSVHETSSQQQILTDENIIKKTFIEPDTEAETKLAVDILSKELNVSYTRNFIDQEENFLLGDDSIDAAENELLEDSETNQKKELEILQVSSEIVTLDNEFIKQGDNIEVNKEILDDRNLNKDDCGDSLLSLPESETDINKSVAEVGLTDEARETSIEAMQCDIENIKEPVESVFPILSNIQINPKLIEKDNINQNIDVNDINMEVEEQSEEMSKEDNSMHDQITEVQETSIGKQNQGQAIQESLEKEQSNAILDQQLTDTTHSVTELQKTAMEISEPQPSTSFSVEKNSNYLEVSEKNDNQDVESNIPFSIDNENSTFGSPMAQNDVSEMSDSLGLLAESSRVVEDDEYDEDGDVDGDDDDDFDNYDDESNFQVTAENSEDSNAQHSETDTKLEAPDKDNFEFTISDVISDSCDKKPVWSNETVAEEKQQIHETDVKEDSNECKLEEDSKDAETEHMSDVCDTNVNVKADSILKNLLITNDNSRQTSSAKDKKSPDDATTQDNVVNIVDLEESSSDDEKESDQVPTEEISTSTDKLEGTIEDITIDNKDVQSETKKSPKKSDKKAEKAKNEVELVNENENKKSQMGLEVYNLDSDEEESVEKKMEGDIKVSGDKKEMEQLSVDTPKCINKLCSHTSQNFYIANFQAINFYDADKKKRLYVCETCADAVEERNQELIAGVKNLTPLLELSFKKCREDLVEISDSESEEEAEFDDRDQQMIGESGAKIIEQQLAAMINETWEKFKMDARLAQSKNALQDEMSRIQKESQELNDLLNECQAATDKLRNDLYSTFEPKIVELPTLVVFDTPNCSYSCTNSSKRADEKQNKDTASMKLKRGRSPSKDFPSKRPAIPLGYTPLEYKTNIESIEQIGDKLDDDSTDVAVVKLSAESAPKDLPPSGEMTFAPLKVGMTVYAMKNTSGSWLKARIVEIIPKGGTNAFTACRVKFEHRVSKHPFKTLPARHLAYYEPPDVRMTIGRRVIALFKDVNKHESFYSGIVAEIPNPVNSYRYLIFFDDGYAQYAPHAHTRLVCECATLVWEEVQSSSREFVRQYLLAYPERPMVRLHAGQNLKTEWRGKWLPSRVLRVDASLVEVQFLKVARREWIYRGSTRLAPLYLEFKAAERHRPRAMPRTQPQSRSNMPYVEYTRSDEQNKTSDSQQQQIIIQQQNEELRRQRAVAKKSTSAPSQTTTSTSSDLDSVCSRVVYYSPKNAVKPLKMVPHICSPKCKRKDVMALKDLRTYNPLARPLLSGWERQIVKWKCHKEVMYRAPCGRRLRDMRELHKYLRDIQSDMAVDLFDFSPSTHCLAEFVLNKCFVGKKDLSHGKENVPVPCVNYYDDSLPEFCSYNTERTPTAGVPLNLDPEFLCGCDCEDDCEDKTKCACWKMTLEGAKTIGLEGDNVGYVYKRLPEPLPSGIYECNSRCKCKHTCLNRVAQHPLQLKLQVFKTANRGWGIRALNDIPKGAFLCVYAGNLLTDATANLDGLNEGDEYLAELDYIEVVEQMKEGYEEDIPEKIKKLDEKESSQQPSEESEDELSSEGESNISNYDQEDDDFQPGYISNSVSEFNKRLRRRDSKKNKEEANQKEKEKEKEKETEKKVKEEKETNPDEECITISDDEEVREPSCFTAAAGMGASEFISKYRSVRTLFGEDEACYIMDAKVQGNIGRYLNHSCSPNVFVQNVFVDTHDPRFPWVAFFALSYIKSGTELTWNYNYDVGSVPGKILYCKCGAANCRGRLL